MVLRDFAYLLMYSEKAEAYGLVSRMLAPLVTLCLVFYVRLFSNTLLEEILGLLAVFTYELILVSQIRGLRGFLSGLRLYVLFTVLSSLIFLASSLLGMLAPDPITIPIAALRLLVLFSALTLLLQVISLSEWRAIFRKLGLKSVAELYSLVLLQLPLVLYYLSESAVTIKLKYKGKRLHRIAIPLILLVAYTSRSTLESYLIYSGDYSEELKLRGKRDSVLYTSILVLIAVVLLPQYLL